MRIPTEITFSGMAPSAAIDAALTTALGWLDRLAGRIAATHVVFSPSDGAHAGGILEIRCALSEGNVVTRRRVSSLGPDEVARAARHGVAAVFAAVLQEDRTVRRMERGAHRAHAQPI